MGNNNLKGTNDILVKVDQNNLIYIDPNSVLSNGVAQPRGVEPENLVMFVNLEADLIPRSILVNNGGENKLTSIAGGTLNFLQNKNGRDYDSTWTDAFTQVTETSTDLFRQNDNSAQTFGIDSISIQITGANFIPRVEIRFIDVRGKTLFESPENSPYGTFFHLPWPVFYLTIKGYYGKAIKYRLHCVSFKTRFNSQNGNLEPCANFVGSTYAYMADITLESVLNAPYLYMSESETKSTTDTKTGITTIKVSKTTKGYRTLKSVYKEYINKGLLPKDFPVKTLREIINIAGRLNKILEKEVFTAIIDPKILSGVKDYETSLTTLEGGITAWKSKNLSPEYFVNGMKHPGTDEQIRWFKLSDKEKRNSLEKVVGPTSDGTLERILYVSIKDLESNQTFGTSRNNKLIKSDKLEISPISLSILKDIKNFYIQDATVGIDIDGVQDAIYSIEKNFVEQRNKLEADIEKRMNEIVKNAVDSNGRHIGLGFEPTIRNIIGVLLANADTYIRLMKDVHLKAFEQATVRKKKLSRVITDSLKADECIYPWPEVKVQSAGGRELVLMYPGARELLGKLESNNRTLWPEVDFVENFYEVATKKKDPLTGNEENVDNIDYIFASQPESEPNDISVLTNLTNYVPYSNKSFSSILYEMYERAKYTTSLNPFSNEVIIELSDVEFDNLKSQLSDDIDIIETLKANIHDPNDLLSFMQSVSTYDRFPYYEDQLPTIPYLQQGLNQDFNMTKYVRNTVSTKNNNEKLTKLSNFLLNYKSENYRKDIYPFNSSVYESYLGHEFGERDLRLYGALSVHTPEDFIRSSVSPLMWVKEGFETNLFNNTFSINNTPKQILNTPYFHQQLYTDFNKTQPQEKYVGSAYLLLNSLPFKDLDDTVHFAGPVDEAQTLISTIFREIGATHYIPYHMMLKWGSIYHRYKRWIVDSFDIIGGATISISGDTFYSGDTVTYEIDKSIGYHPYYENIFHQVVNGTLFFDGTSEGYTRSLTGSTHLYETRSKDRERVFTTFIDESRFSQNDLRYTLLPTNGQNLTYGSDFNKSEQENFRILWGIGTSDQTIINYSGYTLPSALEYWKVTGSTSSNYRKVMDLIATFKPGILEMFEQAFLDFASEKLNQEISYSLYDVQYPKFQDLLKRIVSVTKDKNDTTDPKALIEVIKSRQNTGLITLTSELLSNDNLVRLTMSNPRETDNYVLGGFTGVNVRNFSVDPYDPSQDTADNDKLIKLYLGDSLVRYKPFFVQNDIALNEDNILQFRPLIYIYAGLIENGTTYTKENFVKYLKDNLISFDKNSVTGVAGQDVRLYNFLNSLIGKIQSSNFSVKNSNQTTTIQRGYNDDPIKLELYNFFKVFNDKWTAGNSIGQRTLMEEFLFLDKANRDIGSSVFIDMQKLTKLGDSGNKKINLYSAIALLIQNSGFDIRALPAYVNFYGTNYSSSVKTVPSKNVARNLFGTFLDVDYQESSPKIILQYIGPTSKHLELSDINKKYMFKNDGFDISNVHNNPIIVAPDVFTKTDFSKSNKVVAFEVSFGDQNQSIFKGVDLDQASLKNTSESFEVLERLGRNETGSSTSQIDIGLFDIYRQSSYQCKVTSMGNVMIQPTMYFYVKNIPLFKGSYLITEVTHNIKTTGIETEFKGTRIPQESLPNPEDSFLASYRPLFDTLINRAHAQIEEEQRALLSGNTGTSQTIVDESGSHTTDPGKIVIPGEKMVNSAGVTDYGIPYNGKDKKSMYIQKVTYNQSPRSEYVSKDINTEWLRAVCVRMGGPNYPIADDVAMDIVSNLTTKGGAILPRKVLWKDIKDSPVFMSYYSTRFNFSNISADRIMFEYNKTEFLNPKREKKQIVTVINNANFSSNIYEGPINVGPSVDGYGIGLSKALMDRLMIYDGQVVYFRMSK